VATGWPAGLRAGPARRGPAQGHGAAQARGWPAGRAQLGSGRAGDGAAGGAGEPELARGLGDAPGVRREVGSAVVVAVWRGGGRRWPATCGRGGLARRRGAGANKRSPGWGEGLGMLTETREGGICGPSRQRGLGLGGFRAAARRRSDEPRLKKGAIRALGSSTALGLWPEGARDCGGGIWGGDGAGGAAGRRNGEVELGWWRRRVRSGEEGAASRGERGGKWGGRGSRAGSRVAIGASEAGDRRSSGAAWRARPEVADDRWGPCGPHWSRGGGFPFLFFQLFLLINLSTLCKLQNRARSTPKILKTFG